MVFSTQIKIEPVIIEPTSPPAMPLDLDFSRRDDLVYQTRAEGLAPDGWYRWLAAIDLTLLAFCAATLLVALRLGLGG